VRSLPRSRSSASIADSISCSNAAGSNSAAVSEPSSSASASSSSPGSSSALGAGAAFSFPAFFFFPRDCWVAIAGHVRDVRVLQALVAASPENPRVNAAEHSVVPAVSTDENRSEGTGRSADDDDDDDDDVVAATEARARHSTLAIDRLIFRSSPSAGVLVTSVTTEVGVEACYAGDRKTDNRSDNRSDNK